MDITELNPVLPQRIAVVWNARIVRVEDLQINAVEVRPARCICTSLVKKVSSNIRRVHYHETGSQSLDSKNIAFV